MPETIDIQREYLDYAEGDVVCEAYVVHDRATETKRPCIVVAHDWSGQNESIRAATDELVGSRYIGFGLDIYGKGVRGGETDDNTALMTPFLQDRGLLRRRLVAAVEAARHHPLVDPERGVAVVGYCFGGLCALDVARSGIPGVRGVASIHGVFAPPGLGAQGPISAQVLVLHGWEDPMAPPADLLALARELTEAGADWQIHAYGHAMHSFTWFGVNRPEQGLLYDEAAARRSRSALQHFLSELFGAPGS